MFVRSAHNYDRDEASEASGLVNVKPSKTQQQFKEQADINTIVKNFGVTGRVPVVARTPLIVDFDAPLDYRMMVDVLRDAQQKFMELPAKVRSRFANDPGEFVDFVQNPDNLDELRRMGLALEKPHVAAEGGKSGSSSGEQAGAPA